MAHNLSTASGKVEMAYAGDTPWHGLGTAVDGLQTVEAMQQAAGQDWLVETRPLRFESGESLPVAKGFKAIVRTDTETLLGVATDRYAPFQNHQAGALMDALVTEGQAQVEVAGVLGHGAICWIQSHIPADFEVVKGDLVQPYFLEVWGHDGKHGIAGKLTSTRVVCKNTLKMAGFGVRGIKWKEAADIYLRHSKNISVQIEAAQKALGIIRKQVAETAEAYKLLARTPVSDAQAADFFAGLFPAPESPAVDADEDTQKVYQRSLERYIERQERLAGLFQAGVGSDIPGVRGTAWAAYNAVTEWTDHVYPILDSGKVSTTRQQSVAFGQYSDVKSRALLQALALAG